MDSTMVEVTPTITPSDIERAEKFRRGIGGSYDRDVDRLAAEFARHRIQSEGRTGAGEALEERALAIVKAHYPEMPAHYRGRRYQVALAAIIETRAEIIRSLRHDFDDWPDYVSLADVADELEKDDSQ